MSPSGRIRIRRAYEPRRPEDGRRVLVDRLWPRGLSKARLDDVIWMKELAPSTELRRWFGHRPERWAEFRRRYLRELRSNPTVAALRELAAATPVTLVYSARDEVHNQAVVLAEFLAEGRPARDEGRGAALGDGDAQGRRAGAARSAAGGEIRG